MGIIGYFQKDRDIILKELSKFMEIITWIDYSKS